MRRVTQSVLVLHNSAEFRGRVGATAGKEFTIEFVSDWNGLAQAVRECPPHALVVVDPYESYSPNNGPADELRSLLRSFPSLTVFAALTVSPEGNTDIRQLAKWGVAEFISVGHDDTLEGLRTRFKQAQGRSLKVLMGEVLPEELPARARVILEAAAEIVAVGGKGQDLADKLGLSRRTLLRVGKRSGLPPARELMPWMRVLLAATLLDDPGRSVLSVARSCGYSSDNVLRRVTNNLMGVSPAELRRYGAFAAASKAFVDVVEGYRARRPA